MPGAFTKILKKLAAASSIPVILEEFFRAETGREYGIGFFAKLELLRKMRGNRSKIPTASHFLEHLVMATEVLRVPRSVQGSVVECGTFKGGSAANLSLVCALCQRQLEIFDSFQGLPQPESADQSHVLVGSREIHTYEKGAFSGTLDEVRNNIRQHGNVDVCRFHTGYFEETLPAFKGPCVLAFLDVDLVKSLETCVKYLWPALQDGCYLFTHEAHHMEIPAFFFQDDWWHEQMKCGAPGFVGSGSGIGLQPSAGGYSSALGYTVKNPKLSGFEVRPQTGDLKHDPAP